MSNKYTQVISDSANAESNQKINSVFKVDTSEKKEDAEKIMDVSGDEDSVVLKCCSRVRCIYDDSGFNSSASEDRDDVVNSSLRQNCDLGTFKDLVGGNIETITNISPNPSLKSDRLLVCLESGTYKTLIQDFGNIPSTKKSQENAGCVLSNICQRNIGLDNVSSTRSPCGINRQQRTDTAHSSITFEASENQRISRNRRSRSRDINNNVSGFRNFNAYLKKPPFKLQDCFQDQGLLSLAACAIYTLVLMIVFRVFGMVLDSVKSVIGTQNLKDIRENIAQARRMRSTMACG